MTLTWLSLLAVHIHCLVANLAKDKYAHFVWFLDRALMMMMMLHLRLSIKSKLERAPFVVEAYEF